MYEFRAHGLTRSDDRETRFDIFGEWFDADVDPNIGLAEIVLKLGNALEIIVGPEAAKHIQPLIDPNGCAETWKDAAEESVNYSEWQLSQTLTDLLMYGVFGLISTDNDEKSIAEKIGIAEQLVAVCPVEKWLNEDSAGVLLATVMTARGRMNLDHGGNVNPEALANLGGVKMSRIRNMISGASPDLPRDEHGLVQHGPAMAWLQSREPFLNTLALDELARSEEIDNPVFVPIARDGSIFHPGLFRGDGYTVGAKEDEHCFETFEEALSHLNKLNPPRWRRPNENGNWGIVSGSGDWRRLDKTKLVASVANNMPEQH